MSFYRLSARQALPWVLRCSRTVARIVQWNNPHGRAPELVGDGRPGGGPAAPPPVLREPHAVVGTRAGGYVINACNQVDASLLRFPWGVRFHPVLTLPWLARARPVAGPLLNLVTPEARGNYHHWLMDQVPRLGFFRPDELGAYRTVVASGVGLPYEQETLAAAQIDPARVILAGGNEAFVADEVSTPPLIDAPEWLPWKRDYLRSLWPAGDGAPAAGLFVGRKDARKRRLVDEPALARTLGQLGFESPECGVMTVAQQAGAFAGAKIVVGVHGAALSNCVFMRAGTLLVEILNAQHPQGLYRDLAEMCGVRYHAVLAEPAGASSRDHHHRNSDDIQLTARAQADLIRLVRAER